MTTDLSLSSSARVFLGALIFFYNLSVIHRHTTSPFHPAHTQDQGQMFVVTESSGRCQENRDLKTHSQWELSVQALNTLKPRSQDPFSMGVIGTYPKYSISFLILCVHS